MAEREQKLKQTFVLINDHVAGNAAEYLAGLPRDGSMEVICREISKDKTLKQLAAIFGLWIKYLASKGESEAVIHDFLKARFLARIYITDPQNDAQEAWVELLAVYQESGDQAKLERHAKRISLSWSSIAQTKEYMRAIEQHYQAIGEPLPIPDRYWKHFA